MARILIWGMRNRDPHRENVENILAISLPIVTMQHIRESPSASQEECIECAPGYFLKITIFIFLSLRGIALP